MDAATFTRQFAQQTMKQFGLKEEEVRLFTFVPEPDWDPDEIEQVKAQVRQHLGIGAVVALEDAMQRPRKRPGALRGIFFLANGETLLVEEDLPMQA
jgi:hypothetical protein